MELWNLPATPVAHLLLLLLLQRLCSAYLRASININIIISSSSSGMWSHFQVCCPASSKRGSSQGQLLERTAHHSTHP
jgi:hypothetical protein